MMMTMASSGSEDHYDTPWEFLARPNSVRFSTASAIGDAKVSPHGSPSMCSSSSFVNQLVQIGNSAVDARRRQRDESKRRRPSDSEIYMEQNMNRVEAEKRLENRNLGDYLLRSRGSEGSAALSLRATKGVVHIKIEWNGEKWVIGEGPLFRSINSAISFYRRHPLPIRGADHLVLKNQLRPPV
uniref:SH2 domain-containing protein n=1 Tax=Caenorhabditis tropicalis TaxID=1561998 RepID=A0A1I7UIC0_9PELO